ncbi:MAG: hypothetical protein GXP53_14550 [Deltaproteobacteria bacterium]|nr:hypothetical protein [Deltaproteobacteria bacterium]
MIENLNTQNLAPFLDELDVVFNDMDKEFEDAAKYYGFSCAGCDDNCCKSLFYHYTAAEYLFLARGMDGLSDGERTSAFERADAYASAMAGAPNGGNSPQRIICPLNVFGGCILYGFRPMICRLFGLPHEFTRPAGGRVSGPGCDRFLEVCKEKEYRRFDRTPYYARLAGLEKSLRNATGINGKIKMTVADMLVYMEAGVKT